MMPKTSVPVTRKDLKEAFDQYDEKNRGYRDDILTKMDGVMKELETMREENTLAVGQTRELWEKVDNHEKRIAKLESA